MRYLTIIFLLALQFLNNAWAHFDAVEVAKAKCFAPSLAPDYTHYGYGQKKPLPKATAGDVACLIRDLNRVEDERKKISGEKIHPATIKPFIPRNSKFRWTQTLAYIDNVLEDSPRMFKNQAVLHAKFRAQTTPKAKLTYLKKTRIGNRTFLRALFSKVYRSMKRPHQGNQWNVLEQALEEEVKYKNYFVVYRAGGSEDKFSQDVYGSIMSAFNMRKNLKATRIHFNPHKTIRQFYEEFRRSGKSDNQYGQFGRYAVSGSLSLLDASSMESALDFYSKNTGTVNCNSYDILDRIAASMHIEKGFSNALYSKLSTLFSKGIDLARKLTGSVNLHQVFISPDLVDKTLWAAAPFGKKRDNISTRKKLEKLISNPSSFLHKINKYYHGQCDIFREFQARLFVAHLEFFKPRRVITKFYGQQGIIDKTSKEYRTVLREITKILVSSYMEQLESQASLANDNERLFNLHIDDVAFGAGARRSSLSNLYNVMSKAEVQKICGDCSKAQALFEDFSWQNNAVQHKKIATSIEQTIHKLSTITPDNIRAQFLAAGELCGTLASVWDEVSKKP